MIVSRTPPQQDRQPMPRPEAGNVRPMQSVGFARPSTQEPSAAGNGAPAAALKEVNRSIIHEGGGSSAFHLPPRFLNANEDERDDALGAKNASISARAEPAGRGDVHWQSAMPQQQLHLHHPDTPRRATWSSWTSAPTGNGETGGASWRRHFRTDSDEIVTADATAASVPTTRSYFQAASTDLPTSTSLTEARYQALRHRYTQVQAWPNHQRVGLRAVPVAMTTSPHHQDMRLVPVPVAIATSQHHLHMRSVPVASVAATTAQQQRSVRSVPVAMATTQTHHDTWHWHHRPGVAVGYSQAEHPRPSNPGGAPQYYTAAPTQYSQPWSRIPNVAVERRHLSFASPANHAAKPSTLASSETKLPTTNSPQGSKRLLSPQQQHQLFKKARGFDMLDLLCTATLEIGELHDNPTGCSCPKSKCVALYCDCFKAGRRCHPTRCSCLDCKNTIAESGVDGARTKAIRCILARNPRAFNTAGMGNPTLKLPPGEVACNCVRSRCLKLYCSCFHNSKVCKPEVCTCVGCYNTETDVEGRRKEAIQQTMEKRPNAFIVKPKEKGLGCACKNNRCIRKYCECFRTGLGCTDKCTCRECENGEISRPSSP
jgi:Tesmin/TSO1-like CXC domain, cysteine-rich domain